MGDWAVVFPSAHAWIWLLKLITRCGQSAQLLHGDLGLRGMILATSIFTFGLFARIWFTNVLKAARMVVGVRLFQTSFVPKCMITMSGLSEESQPGRRFWLATSVAK